MTSRDTTSALASVLGWLDAIGDRPCLGDDTGWMSGRTAAAEVRDRRERFGAGRRLVRLVPAPTIDRVLDQLAVLAAGHVLLLTSEEHVEAIDRSWSPDTIVDAGGCSIVRAEPVHDLHPELALLLSTSGSTGDPKLVRLSQDNLVANARSIATSLGLTADDRAITSLPLHYCYGLSVLHAHLAVGASVRLTGASVVDPCFWGAVDADRVTDLAGVPHTFELLERVGLERLAESSIRLVTQAGGRMAPERVRRLAERGGRDGWDLVVMYGQTEATARMACMPPGLAAEHPDAVGHPVPGGSFEIRCPDSDREVVVGDAGRVVYRGPNVMMGYASTPDDLALGRELDELVTGDLGRIDADGLLRIVGRESRFAKLFGLRIDLQRIEQHLADGGVSVTAASDDERLVVAVESPADPELARRSVRDLTGLPAAAVAVVAVAHLPRLSNGKPDVQAVLRSAAPAGSPTRDGGDIAPGATTDADARQRAEDAIASVYRTLLGVPAVGPGDSFVSLGGDSLAYVEVSIRLEERLGPLPAEWHLLPVADLARRAEGGRRSVFWARTDTTVVLRAVAIMLVVSSHMRWFYVPVGSHVLLAVAGYNFARFQLADTTRPRWALSAASTFGKIALVSSVWIALQMWWFGGHGLGTLLLVNSYVGDPGVMGTAWRYWYIEALVHIGVVLVAVLAWPRIRSIERRFPFWVPVALLAPALVLRFEWVMLGSDPRNAIFQADTVLWLFLLGWIIQRAATRWQRAAATALILVSVPGYFWHDDRNLRLLIGLVVLAWVPWIPVPRLLQRVVGWIAAASLSIYLTHYLVFPELDDHLADRWVFPLTIAAGVVAWMVTARVSVSVARRWRTWRDRTPADERRDGARPDEQRDGVRRDERRDGARPDGVASARDGASSGAADEQLDRVDESAAEPARL